MDCSTFETSQELVLLWFIGQSVANQCHGSLSDVPVVKLTNPMQLVVQFFVRLCGCSESTYLLSSLSFFPPLLFPCGIFCLSVVVLTVHFCFPCLAVCVLCVFRVNVYSHSSMLSVCPHQPQSICVCVCVCGVGWVCSDCSCLTVGRVD